MTFFFGLIKFVLFAEATPGMGDKTVREKLRAVGAYTGLGIQLGATVVVFFFIGYYLDRHLGTIPLFTLLGTFVGAGGAFYSIYRKLFPDRNDKKER